MTPRLRRAARTPVTVVLTLGALALTACAPGPSTTTPTLTVFAAASLQGAFTRIGSDYTALHPETTVRFSFNGSATLVDQLRGGARADVLATADETTMSTATASALLAGSPEIVATNTLTLVVAPGNPRHITGLDASLSGTKLVVCAAGVPCGTATSALADAAGVTLQPVSREQRVTDVLGKVTSGEADAGIVYVTDATSAGDAVTTVLLADAAEVVNRYPIGVVASSAQPQQAAAFVAYVRSAAGQATLASFGFGAA